MIKTPITPPTLAVTPTAPNAKAEPEAKVAETLPADLKARYDALLAKLDKYAKAKDGLTSAKEREKCQHTHELHKQLGSMTLDSLGDTIQYVQQKLDSTSNSYSPLLFKAFFSSEAKKMFQEASTLLTLISHYEQTKKLPGLTNQRTNGSRT